MNTPHRHLSALASLLTTVTALGLAALLPNSAKAVIIGSTDNLPTMSGTSVGFYFDAAGQTYANTSFDLGLFSFTANNAYLSVPSLSGLQINIELNDLATKSTEAGFNQVDLTLDGIDTGIALNGYGTGNSGGPFSPGAVTGIANSANAATIYGLFESGGYSYNLPTASGVTVNSGGTVVNSGTQNVDPAAGFFNPALTGGTTAAGQLVVGLQLVPGPNAVNYASDDSPQEVLLEGGTASLQVSNNPIPFEPSQALGFGLIALFVALWYVPQANQMMRRILVPAAA